MRLATVRNCLIACCLLILSGCSMFSPVKSDPDSMYTLDIVPPVPTYKKHSTVLLVMEPDTVSIYNTTQMAYSTKAHEIAFYSKNRWAQTPSQMLHPLIVQGMQNTHYFRAVVTPPYAGRYDYVLNMNILKLQLDFTRNPSQLRLTVRAQLSRVATNQVIATKQFVLHRPAFQNTPYSGVLAANQVAADLVRQLVTFTIKNVR